MKPNDKNQIVIQLPPDGKFQAGDVVEVLDTGQVTTVEKRPGGESNIFCLYVKTGPAHCLTLTERGMHLVSDPLPVISFISRPKKKVRKQITGWVNVYHDSMGMLYESKALADEVSTAHRIACVQVSGEYEVEE